MDFYNVLLAKKTNRVLQFGSLYDRLFETWINRARQILKDLPTGAISTVNDAAELPLNALKVSVEAWQEGSGDPSPSNIRLIHGWDSGEIFNANKNLADNNSIIKLIGNSNNTYVTTTAPYGSIVVPIKGGRQYVISLKNAQTIFTSTSEEYPTVGGSMVDPYTGTGGQAVTTKVVNTGANAKYLVFHTGNFDFEEAQVELGNQATTYEPYQGKQYTLNFPTTIYGAEWDVINGGMNNQQNALAIGDLPMQYNASIKTFYLGLNYGSNNYPLPPQYTVSQVADATAEVFKVVSSNAITNDLTLDSCFSLHNQGSYCWLNIRCLRYDNVNDFVNAMGNYKIKYLLATPTTIPLSPLSIRMLQGVNNVYADCGEVLSGKYWAEV